MRLSVNSDDAGNLPYGLIVSQDKVPYVYLDGVPQPNCVMADEERGEITRCIVDEKGYIQEDPNNPGFIWQETVTGKVTIEVRDRK